MNKSSCHEPSPENAARVRRRRMQRRKALSRLTDHVTHDFRASLTVVREYASLMQDGLCGDVNDEQRHALAVIDDRADELGQMIDDLLDLSKMHTGRMALLRRTCRVAEIVEPLLPWLEKKAALKGLAVETEVDDGLPAVFCDPEMIGRALVSLAVHAVKSCGNSGRILVWALEDRQKRQMTLGVTGNGSRVGQDGPPHDFGQYEAPARKRRNGQKGFRLGLSVAKKLVHRNFGELTELPTDGPGTALACSLPLSIPEEILQRYLLRLHQGPRSRAAVSAARAWVEAPHDSDSIASIDKLFHFALRPDDLVFRIGKAEWMFVLAEKCPGESRFLARLEDVRKDIDRHRLRGELPEIEMKMEGAWSLAADTSDVLSRIVMLLTPLETRHATIDDAPAGQILENAAASA